MQGSHRPLQLPTCNGKCSRLARCPHLAALPIVDDSLFPSVQFLIGRRTLRNSETDTILSQYHSYFHKFHGYLAGLTLLWRPWNCTRACSSNRWYGESCSTTERTARESNTYKHRLLPSNTYIQKSAVHLTCFATRCRIMSDLERTQQRWGQPSRKGGLRGRASRFHEAPHDCLHRGQKLNGSATEPVVSRTAAQVLLNRAIDYTAQPLLHPQPRHLHISISAFSDNKSTQQKNKSSPLLLVNLLKVLRTDFSVLGPYIWSLRTTWTVPVRQRFVL